MERLPRDVIGDILSRVPVQSLGRAKYVCKEWHSIIVGDPFFFKAQLLGLGRRNNPCLLVNCTMRRPGGLTVSSLFLVDPEEPHRHHPGTHPHQMITLCPDFQLPGGRLLTILGSSDGILCLGATGGSPLLYLCNPILGEYLQLPSHPHTYTRPTVNGFGRDPLTGDFKVVVMYYSSDTNADGPLSCDVCTVAVDQRGCEVSSWKYVGVVPSRPTQSSPGLLLNGRLHWPTAVSGNNGILSFDLHEEEFHTLPGPRVSPSLYLQLQLLGGHLAFLALGSPPFHIWVMRDYGERESWVKEYTIVGEAARQLSIPRRLGRPSLSPRCFWNAREILIQRCSDDFVAYDTRSGALREVNICGPTCNLRRQVKICDISRRKPAQFLTIRSSLPHTCTLLSFKGKGAHGNRSRNTVHTTDWSTIRHGNDEVIKVSEAAVSEGCFEFSRVPLLFR